MIKSEELNIQDSNKFDNISFLNPYSYFGQPSTWPRGYPLEKITEKCHSFKNQTLCYNNLYRIYKESTIPLIQQGLVNSDPDMDAIYRQYILF